VRDYTPSVFLIYLPKQVRQTAQVIGPVLGGLITDTYGFRAIFWFLMVVGSVIMAILVVFLPETLPSIAGDGTVRLQGINKPLLYNIWRQPDVCNDMSSIPTKRFSFSSLWTPYHFLSQFDVFAVLFYGAVVYTVHNMVTSSTTALLQPLFKLTDRQTGLIFLPNGLGVILGSFAWGKVLDRNWKHYEKKQASHHGRITTDRTVDTPRNSFPVERARLLHSWWLLLMFVAAVGGYGFSLSTHSLPGVLALQFYIAFAAQAVFAMCSALAIDLFPGAAASVAAVQNLVRCSLGAVGVAIIDVMLEKLGPGKTYALCASVTAVASVFLGIEWIYGHNFRRKRDPAFKHAADKKTLRIPHDLFYID
jgi:MFS family permease